MAVFSGLSEKLQAITDRIRGKGRITERDLKDMMREIRLALLEADVHYQVVKDLTKEISEQAEGKEIIKSITPGQQIVKIVNDALTEILGGSESKLAVNPRGFTVYMLYGLQGAGKTTTAAKLAYLLKEQGKKPILTSVDVHRPAAADQLQILAESIDVPCYIDKAEKRADLIATEALARGKYLLCDTLIVDTAGRTTIDQEMMAELKAIALAVNPDEKLLIVDAMIGQEAVNVALEFDKYIGLDGFIMTKLDGDARGGAALSIRRMTGKPIKLVGMGEKIDQLEVFHPERMASRILGMGDVVTLVEKAARQIDEAKAQKTLERLQKNQFTLQDMLEQFEQVKNLGSMQDMMAMFPGGAGKLKGAEVDEKEFDRLAAIIRSMTMRERNNPKILNASRRKRIASGSGTSIQEVNRLIKQYEQTQKLMKQFSGMSKGGKRGMLSRFGLGF
ncbi:MAG: signal recognition particle protein [Clostridiaceae bacterium]|jgi:signal recognition particle subunit SRP54|nr:signal recognition particle protein [Clostridiaceae bacterium]